MPPDRPAQRLAASTGEEVAEWERLAEAATPGPWWTQQGVDEDGKPNLWWGVEAKKDSVILQDGWCEKADAAFIAAARTALPALLADRARLLAVVEAAEEYVKAEQAWLDAGMNGVLGMAADATAARLRSAVAAWRANQ